MKRIEQMIQQYLEREQEKRAVFPGLARRADSLASQMSEHGWPEPKVGIEAQSTRRSIALAWDRISVSVYAEGFDVNDGEDIDNIWCTNEPAALALLLEMHRRATAEKSA